MKFKHIIFSFFISFLFLFFHSNVKAFNISYCDYGNGINLVLPVTIGATIDVVYPMEHVKDYSYSNELFVYDEESCNQSIPSTTNQINGGYPIITHYYIYNSKKVYVDFPLGKGIYTGIDLIPPVIKSSSELLTFSVDKYIELDMISVYINAFDETDGNIILEAIYDNYTPNYNKIGEYSIIFRACDSSNNCSTYDQRIKTQDIIAPSISGSNKITTYMSNPIALNDIGKNLIATDNYDGDLSTNIFLQSSSYNPNIPGTYYAYYTIKDSSNNELKTPFKVEILVVDDIAPTIEGPTFFTNKLSSILSTKTILSNMIVNDNSDANAYKNIYIIDDNYTNNNTKIGEYTLVIGCYDKYGNESLPYIITIKTIDEIPPVIEGVSNYTSYLSSPISLLTIKSNLVVLDNYDGNLFNNLEIIEDTYTNNKNSVGIYNIVFIVKDSSNNYSSSFNVEITTIDNIIPNIEGVSFYETLNNSILDVMSIKYNLIAIDNIDGNISDSIEFNSNTYKNNEHIPGTYFLSFYVSDNSGNISNDFIVKIIVKENMSELEKLNNSLIHLKINNYKDESEILNILGINQEEYNSVIAIENTYVNNFNNIGTYSIKYEFTNTDYTKSIININIHTYEEKSENNTNQESPKTTKETKKKENIFSKIFSFFKSIFSSLLTFFKRLFR